MSDIVWGNFTQEELDRQYDQGTLVPNTGELMEINAQESAKIRTELECIQNVSYGPTVMERLDIFPVATKGAPVVIYHHGGAWTRSDKDQCSYVAPPFVESTFSCSILHWRPRSRSTKSCVRTGPRSPGPGIMPIHTDGTETRFTVSVIHPAAISAA